MSMKNPLTSAGIEPATFRFVAQHLNHRATAVPHSVRGTVFNAYQRDVGPYENSKPTNPRLMAIICVALFRPCNARIFILPLS